MPGSPRSAPVRSCSPPRDCSTGADLCLHVVRQDYGAHVASQVARRLVAPPQREGNQRQYIDPVPAPQGNGDLGDTLQWALEHLDEALTVGQLARRARVSVRTLHRHFRDALGTTPDTYRRTFAAGPPRALAPAEAGCPLRARS